MAMTPLQKMGENIRLVRQSQRFSITLLANYAGISRPLLRRIESGEESVSIGAVYAVLRQLGLEKDFMYIANREGIGLDNEIMRSHRYFWSGIERDKRRIKGKVK
jgi:transcriptional regulator with XRE-family HTH domain